MNSKYILCALILYFPTKCFSQIPYNDAVELKSYYDDKSNQLKSDDRVYEILDNYYEPEEANSKQDIYDAFSAPPLGKDPNPFIEVDGSIKSTEKPNFVSKSLSSVGGLDVSDIARGISLFMISRAKKELNAAFFERLKKQFKKNPEIQILFPKTSSSVEQLLSYHYSEMLPVLRTNFFDDLKKISTRLDDLMELDKYAKLLEEFPEVRMAIRSIQLIHNLENEEIHPADLIEQLASFPEWSENSNIVAYQNFGNSMKFAAILSNSLRYYSGGKAASRAWINSKELLDLFKDDVTFKIFMGLIYQQVKDKKIKFMDKNGANIDNLIENDYITLFKYQIYVREFIVNAGKVDEKIKTIKSSDEKPSKEDLYQYINNSIDIIESGLNIAKLINQELQTKEYISLTRSGNDLYKNIFQENYSTGVSDLIEVIDNLVSLTSKNLKYTLEKDENEKRIDTLQHSLTFVRKYGLFAANIVEAESAEEVQGVIESAALPVGSSSLKKHSDINISVQSFLGVAYSTGMWTKASQSLDRSWDNNAVVFAPIGVSFDHGFGNGGSLGLFVSVLDVGAIVDYELRSDTTFNIISSGISTDTVKSVENSQNYKIELGQIFSPGFFVTYGFPFNTPMAINIGAQYGPGLMEISDSNTILGKPNWRFVASLTVDIPWFTLFNNEKLKFRKKK